jgi:prenylcysteine oxidase / farnesylcysteine lyase
LHPVELGASIYVKVNSILVEAAKEFGLDSHSLTNGVNSQSQSEEDAAIAAGAPGIGIWNGYEFVFKQSTTPEGDGLGWWDLAKLIWRYGTNPIFVNREMKASVGKFLGMYDVTKNFPWNDLTDEVQRRGLLENAGFTAEQYLKNKGLWGNGKFVQEIVQAATRVNYAQNLGVISGMESLVSIATDGAMAVKGGNWQIFDGMVTSSGAEPRLNTTVMAIEKLHNGRFSVSYKSSSSASTLRSEDYDEVIVASPWQFTSVNASTILSAIPRSIPYVHLHVTLFTSPHPLSPAFFGQSPDDLAPLVVLTTLPLVEDADSPLPTEPTYAGKAGFFSISRLRTITKPSTNSTENLYKIFTPKPVTPEFLHSLLGLAGKPPKSLEHFDEKHISWTHVKEWQSYPVEYPRSTFDKIKLADGLWYTGAMDAFISTMETNALMGKNVAALVVNEWILE